MAPERWDDALTGTKPRRIAVFTGNRAEYGLQYPILDALRNRSDVRLQLIVSGAHLDGAFGETVSEIHKDGFTVDAKVKIRSPDANLQSTSLAIGECVLGVANALGQLKPDIFLVYADRFEGFAAVIAATQSGIPTAHMEGGDVTQGGALDDSVRHAMTKLAHIHLTTNDQASIRIMGMGEEPWRVHTVGFPLVDLIQAGDYMQEQQIVDEFQLDMSKPVLLFTQHSVTTFSSEAGAQLEPSLIALKRLYEAGFQIIMTCPNNDSGGKEIAERLQEFAAANSSSVQIRQSLGRRRFHGILALALNPDYRVVLAGNSSAGIKEAPSFMCPTVNIGTRQSGRLRADNVIDAEYDGADIEAAVLRAAFDEDFRHVCRTCDNPYYMGNVGQRTAEILATTPLGDELLVKKMTLAGETSDGWFR